MNDHEKKVSDYIDQLNAEKIPDDMEHSEELAELFQTVKKVRTLKEAKMPEPGFQKKLAHSIKKELMRSKAEKKRKWIQYTSMVSFVAIILLTFLLNIPMGQSDIVNAMEKAFQKVEAYHGIIEITETNGNGESTIQSKLEIWMNDDGQYYVKGVEGAQKGIITVNNGERKWQVRLSEQEVHILEAIPDTNRFIFELGNEVDKVKNAEITEVIGEDVVAGREATIVQITPQGGDPYRIWIDHETNLPLQKQSAMHNAVQYTTTYTEFELTEAIPEELTAYQIPEGYKEINENPEQIVANIMEAEERVGFLVAVPSSFPNGFKQKQISVTLNEKQVNIYYQLPNKKRTIIISKKNATNELNPKMDAMLGKINGADVEIQSPIQEDIGILSGGAFYEDSATINSIRWQEGGFEFTVVGNVPVEDLQDVTNHLSKGTLEMPTVEKREPAVAVPNDVIVEENEQKSVDAGHSPWRLDPVFVAQVFVSLQIHPEGIVGKYPINIDDFHVIEKTNEDTIIDVTDESSPVARVYLKRIIRQDSTGIWTVVGYDPIK